MQTVALADRDVILIELGQDPSRGLHIVGTALHSAAALPGRISRVSYSFGARTLLRRPTVADVGGSEAFVGESSRRGPPTAPLATRPAVRFSDLELGALAPVTNQVTTALAFGDSARLTETPVSL